MKIGLGNIIIPAIILGAISCGKIRQIPIEPHIEFREVELYDTIEPQLGNLAKAARVLFYFEDGDGDIGIRQPTGDESDTLNLFFEAFIKKDGVFVEPEPGDFVQSTAFRIPFLQRPGQNQIIQGTMEVILFYYFFNVEDTVKYEFYLIDRAGHESNREETCVIPFSLVGICN
ncbi:MAG: hypothetical protein E4G95_07325 [Bacteroidia bacterium]|nr:MAG: hypothetical protein E4G95_07325 [Bacteroidia bacterium]